MSTDDPSRLAGLSENEAAARLASEGANELPRTGRRSIIRIALEVLESQFESEGEIYLFAAILHEFFSLYSTINTFHELEIQNVERHTAYRFPATVGRHQLL